MTSKGKTWKWSKESKKNFSEKLKGKDATSGSYKPKHGLSRHSSYNSWKKMMQRCYQEHNPSYKDYGERGIIVCDRWHDVTNFVEDMGVKPDKCSIERIDVDGNYEPSNCTWIPMRMQAKNRRPWKHTKAGLENIAQATSDRTLGKKRESFTGKWIE